MNPMHQLTRRPVKAAFGALLLALAGVILALSGGQFWAAARTRAGVEATYTTVAVVTGRISSDEVLTPSAEGGSNAESLRQGSAMAAAIFLAEPEQQNWSIIRSRPKVGLVSGYSSGLKPAISLYTGHSSSDAPYEYSIVEIRADAVTEVNNDWFGESGSANWLLEGQVLGIYGLNDAFRDPSGQRASVLLHQEYDDPQDLLQPEAGKRYLLLSYSYGDSEWSLRRNVADWVFMETNVQLDPWSLDISGNLIRYEQRKNQSEHWYHTAGDAAEEPVEFAPEELLYRDPATGVEVTSIDPDAFGQFSFAVDALKDTGEIMVEDPQQPGNWRPETVDYTQYNLPSIQELTDGVTAQEVMDNTSSWRMAMESIQTNNQSVPVLAVDFVEGMLEFASERAQVTQGRSFSQSEYDSGAAVCLISETLARESGLDVGDTLPLSLYEKEKKPDADHGWRQRPDGILLPAAKGLPAGDGVYRHRSVSPEQRMEPGRGQFYAQHRAGAAKERHLRRGDRRNGAGGQLRLSLGDDGSAKRYHRPDGGPTEGKRSGRHGDLLRPGVQRHCGEPGRLHPGVPDGASGGPGPVGGGAGGVLRAASHAGEQNRPAYVDTGRKTPGYCGTNLDALGIDGGCGDGDRVGGQHPRYVLGHGQNPGPDRL